MVKRKSVEPHPVQPIIVDKEGAVRFKRNAIVAYLLDTHRITMNDLALMPFDAEDREQFAQLIGYSVSGFAELPYVRDKTWERVETSRKKQNSGVRVRLAG
jgi:hypothetical protein